MKSLFILQLVSSFIVGGAFVSILSLAAEKASQRMAGVILAFPSTIALGFFFLSWTVSPEEAAKSAPATFISLGILALFPVFYVKLAEKSHLLFKERSHQILFSISLSLLLWFVLSSPAAIYQFSNLWIGVTIYILLMITSYFLLHLKHLPKPKALKYSNPQKLIRALLAGLAVSVIVFLGKTLDAFWGGIFTMFPAVFSTSFVLFHWHYGHSGILPNIQKIPIGSLTLFTYALMVMLTFPRIGFIWGTMVAYLASFTVILGILFFSTTIRKKKRLPNHKKSSTITS